jgi:hypothetical protein
LLVGACDTAGGADDNQQPTAALEVPNTGTRASGETPASTSSGPPKFDLTKAVAAPRGPQRPSQANAGTGAPQASRRPHVHAGQKVP